MHLVFINLQSGAIFVLAVKDTCGESERAETKCDGAQALPLSFDEKERKRSVV